MIQFQGIHSFTNEIQAKAVVHATDKSFSMYQGMYSRSTFNDLNRFAF